MRYNLIILSLFLMVSAIAHAHDFTAEADGQTLHFAIISKNKKTVAVTYPGRISDKKDRVLTGTVEIPAKVKHGDATYSVTAIGPKAFSGEQKLKGIVIPSGVASIGDFAFEDCDSLTSVIFPGNPVDIGESIFFRDTEIANLTIGSDWTSVDFTMLRWSDRLESISIPAKIAKIQGLKKLKQLKEISIDPNNRCFSSDDGILYSKDGKQLIICPRGKEGAIAVKDGTETIQEGALQDCTAITAIEMPASLANVSFRETARMKGLSSITMKGEKPIATGYADGKGYFLFQLADPKKTSVFVTAKAKDEYINALATHGGEYCPEPDGIAYMVEQTQLPEKKNVKAIKK